MGIEVVEARIRREHGKFPLEWQSHEWGILPTLSSYPRFNNIPDRKVKTWKEEILLNHKEIC